MKKVLLISNKVFHYRVPIYNYFYKKFQEHQIEFVLLTNEIQENSPESPEFRHTKLPFNIFKYIRFINETDPDAIIFFLHLKDKVLWPLLYYAKLKGIPLIKWGHGVNLLDQNNKLKKKIFDHIHNLCTSIIVYSDHEKRHFLPHNQSKLFVAYNTINFNSFPDIQASKAAIKEKYGIPYEKIVLFVGRVTKAKRLDILLNIFSNKEGDSEGLVIVGPNIPEEYKRQVENSPAIMCLGAIYDAQKINEIFKMADVFCIPGANGLGVNQAMYWGLPVVTIKSDLHSPEIMYVESGRNGFMVESESELEEKIHVLLNDEQLLKETSAQAANDIRKNASIDRMFKGFLEAVEYATRPGK